MNSAQRSGMRATLHHLHILPGGKEWDTGDELINATNRLTDCLINLRTNNEVPERAGKSNARIEP